MSYLRLFDIRLCNLDQKKNKKKTKGCHPVTNLLIKTCFSISYADCPRTRAHPKKDVWLLSRGGNPITGDIDALMDAIATVISAHTRNKGRRRCRNPFLTSPLTCQVTAEWFHTEMCPSEFEQSQRPTVQGDRFRPRGSFFSFFLVFSFPESPHQQYFQLLTRVFGRACWSIYAPRRL